MKRIFVGDIITTKTNFHPKTKKGQTLKPDLLRGIVVTIRGEYYGIRFGQGLEFTNYLDGLLGLPVGYLVKKDEFDVNPLMQ